MKVNENGPGSKLTSLKLQNQQLIKYDLYLISTENNQLIRNFSLSYFYSLTKDALVSLNIPAVRSSDTMT